MRAPPGPGITAPVGLRPRIRRLLGLTLVLQSALLLVSGDGAVPDTQPLAAAAATNTNSVRSDAQAGRGVAVVRSRRVQTSRLRPAHSPAVIRQPTQKRTGNSHAANTANRHATLGSLALINADRAASGLPPLRWSACLTAIAGANARRMAGEHLVSHADGAVRDLDCNLGNQSSENVGVLSDGPRDGEINSMFMASPSHRVNILGDFHFVGVSWSVASDGSAYIAEEFA